MPRYRDKRELDSGIGPESSDQARSLDDEPSDSTSPSAHNLAVVRDDNSTLCARGSERTPVDVARAGLGGGRAGANQV